MARSDGTGNGEKVVGTTGGWMIGSVTLELGVVALCGVEDAETVLSGDEEGGALEETETAVDVDTIEDTVTLGVELAPEDTCAVEVDAGILKEPLVAARAAGRTDSHRAFILVG